MGWTAAQWEDRIRARLGDLGVLQLVAGARIPFALETALATYSNDNPRVATQTFAGDGLAFDFDLAADSGAPPFDVDWSRVTLVEYPTGLRDPSYLDPGYGWVRLQNTATVRLPVDTPATGESVAITYLTRWPHPTATAGDDLIPPVHAPAVAALAAAEAAKGEATGRARRHDASVMTTLVESNVDALLAAAAAADKYYRDTVLGRPATGDTATPQVGYGEITFDVFPTAIFHTRHRL